MSTDVATAAPSGRPSASARRRALLALLLTVPAPTVGVLFAMRIAPGPVGTTVFIASKAWLLAVPLLWRLLVERERPSLSPARHGGFPLAAGLGLAIFAVIVIAYLTIGGAWIDVTHVRAMAEQNGIGTPARYLGAAAYWILVNSVLEEYVYRWFMFRQCERLVRPGAAVLLSALFFTIHHVVALRLQFDWNVTVLGSLGVFIGGAIWSWLYLRTRSIWPPYLSHAIVDVAVFLVGWLIIFGPAASGT